jgi:formylglycine-generating enzyme required for sulfatase activity
MRSTTGLSIALGLVCMTFASAAWADGTGANPGTLAPLAAFQDCAACPEMIVVPPGAFMMGAVPGESKNPFDVYGDTATFRKRRPDEQNIIPSEHPRHRVEMDIPYAIARDEITHAEWMTCVTEGGAPIHRIIAF